MENIKWQDLSNNQIQLKQLELKDKFESIKNEILRKTDELDGIEKEYQKGEKELRKRLKY